MEYVYNPAVPSIPTRYNPDKGNFFQDASEKIANHLSSLKPTQEEFVAWLCSPEEIDRKLTGTSLARLIPIQAPAQRSAVFACLQVNARALVNANR